MKKILISVLLLASLFACGKKETPTTTTVCSFEYYGETYVTTFTAKEDVVLKSVEEESFVMTSYYTNEEVLAMLEENDEIVSYTKGIVYDYTFDLDTREFESRLEINYEVASIDALVNVGLLDASYQGAETMSLESMVTAYESVGYVCELK